MANLDELELQNQLLSEQLEANRINTDIIREQVSLAKQLSDMAKISGEQALRINRSNRELTNLNKQLVDQATQREKLTRSQREIEKDLTKALNITKSLDTEILQLREKALLVSGRERAILLDIVNGLEEQRNMNQENITSLEMELSLSNKINSAFGIGGMFLKGWSATLKKIGIDTNDIAETTREEISDLEAQGKLRDGFAGKLQGLGVIGKNVGKALLGAIKDPLVIGGFLLTQLTQAFLKLDDLAGETAKTFGTSFDEASKINERLTDIAASSNNIFINTKSLVKAQNELNVSLGTNVALSGELLTNYVELTVQAGYSVEAVTTLSKLSGATNKTLKEISAQYLGQIKSLSLQNNLAINGKALLNDINNTSKALLATYSQNPAKLAEAAFEAKKLGTNIKEVEGIAKSLLDIESSIASEFEAEVITGRMLNLERARYYALTNDIAGLSKEITKQGIDLTKWGGLNAIQQESIAKAIGLSKDQMGEMLIEQQALAKLGYQDNEENRKKLANLKAQGFNLSSIADLGKEELDRQTKSANIQERFLALTEKLKESFVALAEPVMAFVSPLIDLVSFVLTPIANAFNGIKDIISAITDPTKSLHDTLVEMGPVTAGIAGALTAAGVAVTASLVPGLIRAAIAAAMALPQMISMAIAAISTASATTLGIGAIAIAGGIAASVAAMNSAKSSVKMNDGVIDSDGGVVVSGPKGSIQLNKDDKIIAGTNLFGDKQPSSNISDISSTLGNKMDVMINKLDSLIGAVNRGMVVNLDGNKVSQELSTPMAISTRRI